jgi:DNA-binding NarL/FixJ family response regulator
VATERAPAPEPVATRHNLSRRELEVLQLVAAGMTNRQIADAMFLSPRTIASHIASILAKLDLPSRTSAVAYAIRNHLA